MSRSKRAKYQPKPFESSGASSDTSANLYMSMLTSAAFKALTAQQKVLYLYCKSQYYGEKHHPGGEADCFYMNQSMWSDLFQLYDKSSNKTGFRRDRDALIEKGFIACVEDGSPTRTKSVYRFSFMWQKYGKEGFCVRDCDKTASMLKKANKKGAAPGNI